MNIVAIAEIATGAIAVAGVVVSGFQFLRRRLKARDALRRKMAYLVDEINRRDNALAYRAGLESEVVYLVKEVIRLERELAEIQADPGKRTRRRRA